MAQRIVLDTDMGSDVDDALALALAVASPEIELVAVTTVSREPGLRARVARKLLDLAGRPDVPVFAGCARPRAGGDTFVWFGNEGGGILEPADAVAADGEHAVDALARLLGAEDGLEVCAVGPLTNIGELRARHPDAFARIARLTIMGGHLREVAYGGAVFPHGVDYNPCSDPLSSLEVLRAPVPTRLVTADVTLQTWMTPADVERLAARGTPFHAALARAVRLWTPIMRGIFSGFGARMGDDNAAFLHDPLALACVHDESFCRFEELEIEPAMEGAVFRTIERSSASPASRRMRCATAVDAVRFRAHFMDRVLAVHA
jgi:inosine-uridine nucleoside N-ribohydrolase